MTPVSDSVNDRATSKLGKFIALSEWLFAIIAQNVCSYEL